MEQKIKLIKNSMEARRDLGLHPDDYGMCELYGIICAKLEYLVNSTEQGEAFKADFLRLFKNFVK